MERGKKPSLAILIGAGKKKDEEEPEEESGGEDMSSHKAELAKEVLSAVKSNDAEKLAKALCAMMEVHGSSKDEGEYSEDDEETGEDEEG